MREDWIESTIVDICDIHDNLRKPINSKERNDRINGKKQNELYPYYGATGQVGYIDDYLTDGDYILLGEDAAPFLDYSKDVAYKISGKTWVNNHAHILKSKFYDDYLFHYLNHFNYRNYVSGTTRLKLTQGRLKQIPVIIPPLVEQKTIVKKIEELFSSLDSGIADLKKAQEQLKIYRQSVLKKAFEGELTKDWREKQANLPSAEELLEQIEIGRQNYFNKQIEEWELELKKWKEKGEIGKKPKKPRPLTIPDEPNNGHNERKWVIPNNWVWSQIGSLCFVTKLAGFEYTDYVNYDENGDLPVLKAENAGLNGFKKTDFSKVKSESVKMLTRSQIFGGELLVVFVGAGTGNVAMVPFNQRYFLGPNIGMARPYFDLNSKYVELFLQSAFGKSLMMSAVKAVAQPSLSMGTIRQAPIAFPSLKEQQQIVSEIENRLSVCDTIEKDIAESLTKAQALRQSILKKAFEGKLLSEEEIAKCKTDKGYEPASVLLERIKEEK